MAFMTPTSRKTHSTTGPGTRSVLCLKAKHVLSLGEHLLNFGNLDIVNIGVILWCHRELRGSEYG